MRDGPWRRFWRGTLTGGLAAGILDTFLAMAQYGIGPIIVYLSRTLREETR